MLEKALIIGACDFVGPVAESLADGWVERVCEVKKAVAVPLANRCGRNGAFSVHLLAPIGIGAT
jgi:hypothetical protein